MITRHTVPTILPALLLIACGSDEDPGQLEHGILAGASQTVTAGATTLPSAVTWALRRNKNGTITVYRILDAALPAKAWAQGTPVTVKGSPVPGAVVCATENGIKPFTPCTNTGADGNATFFYDVTTKSAGDYRSEIRGTVNNAPAVFDTVKVSVVAAPPAPQYKNDLIGERSSPATYLPAHLVDPHGNAVPYRIPSDARLLAADTALGSTGARTVNFVLADVDSTWRTLNLTGRGDTAIARFSYRLVRYGNTPRIQAVFCGLAVVPCVSETWKP